MSATVKLRDRPTPRTDAFQVSLAGDYATAASRALDFARRLEQERDAAVEALDKHELLLAEMLRLLESCTTGEYAGYRKADSRALLTETRALLAEIKAGREQT